MPACSGITLCPKKYIGTPLFERPVKKYTSSNSMVRSYVPIWNHFSMTSHKLIMCSSNKISFFIFCNLKNFSKPQALNAAHVRGLRKVAKSSISFSHSFHSIMVAEITYKQKKTKNFIIQFLAISAIS
jgi:hypothetical protein